VYADIQWYNKKYGSGSALDLEERRPGRYLVTSTALHALFFATLWIAASLVNEIIPPPVVEISFIENAQTSAPKKSSAAAVALPKAAPEVHPSMSHAGEVKATSPKDSDVLVKASAKRAHLAAAKPKAPKATTVQVPVRKELSTGALEKMMQKPIAFKAKPLSDSELDDAFKSVDQEHKQKISQLKTQLASNFDQELSEQDEKSALVKKHLEAQNLAAASRAQALRAQRQNAIQAAQASEAQTLAEQSAREEQEQAAERAQAEVLANQLAAQAREVDRAEAEARAGAAADREAAAKAASREAEAKEAAARAQVAASDKAGSGIGGVNGPIRDVSDLRAMPGNKRPQYDSDDRLLGRQGEVAFLAYVTKDGSISKFKLLKSTGHRELDSKTYAAIRTWKFYPGQEGWVEIPFRWDLKGGPQEVPATLRRKISQR
jgi:TonB family protein